MKLVDLRNMVFSYGFDPGTYLFRVTQWLNDGQNFIARRVNYYGGEATLPFNTGAGAATYGLLSTVARVRSVVDLGRQTDLQAVTLSDIDRSPTSQGQPNYYALDGFALHLYPTPDQVYNLELRYWTLPPALALDSDVPSLPADWHRLLWMWAVMECYYAEDDPEKGQVWKQRFDETLSEFASDAKFPNVDMPHQVRGMWDQDSSLGNPGWSAYIG